MKLTTSILAVAMMTGAVWAQSPDAVDKINQSKAAQPAKPAAGASAPAVKPAAIPGAKAAAATKPAGSAKPVAAPAPKPVVASASASSQNNRLEAVKVVRNADDIQVEISSREAVTPKVSKLSSPARVLVELPATIMANAESKIAVGSAGVKGVRIGMDGKTPPTTSVVVDLEQACAYELKPGPGNGFVLTLHTQAVAKNSPAPAPAKTSSPAAKTQIAVVKPVAAIPVAVKASTPAPAPKAQAATIKPVVSAPVAVRTAAPAAKVQAGAIKPVVAVPVTPAPKAEKIVAVSNTPATKDATTKITASKPVAASDSKITVAKGAAPAANTKVASLEKPTAASKIGDVAKPKVEEKKWPLTGTRDPFFSPVVQQRGGSGCSSGKKCLEIGQINVRGVVKADSGFIAVVTNSLNKAYFLHENDPVFNGYVVRITGDSVVFQETMQDKLGKSFTREVVKKITTPAV
jgi:hypothetical protein